MNGEKIAHRNAKDTSIEVIERLGIERVNDLGIANISTSNPKKVDSTKIGQYFVDTHNSTERKKDILEKIASEFGVSLLVEIVKKQVATQQI